MFSVSTMMDALAFAQEHDVGLERVVTDTCRLGDAPAAIKAFEAGRPGKTVFVWDD